jgi:hypothetical protein
MRHTVKRVVVGLAALSALALAGVVTASTTSGAVTADSTNATTVCPNNNTNWDNKPPCN